MRPVARLSVIFRGKVVLMFGRFFNRDHHYYISQGDKFLAVERYAEARNAFDEALSKMKGADFDQPSLMAEVKEKLAITGNKLALLNLAEAINAHAP